MLSSYESVFVSLKPREEKPDWFLSRAPLGMVPVLEKDDVILWDSNIINEYLDEVYPEPHLSSRDPLEKAKEKLTMTLIQKVHVCPSA